MMMRKTEVLSRFFVVLIAVLWSLPLMTAQQGNNDNELKNGEDGIQTTAPTPGQSPKPPAGIESPNQLDDTPVNNLLYVAIITVACIIGALGFVAIGVCWFRQKNLMLASARVLYRSSDSSILIHNKAAKNESDDVMASTRTLNGLAKKTDYPAYGVTGPNPLHEQSYEPPIDGTLNRSAEVYHYNQTKKRMKALSGATSDSGSSSRTHDSHDVAADSEINDEETSDGEYTVYECSGMASAADGPMEVRNPFFDEMPNKTNSHRGLAHLNTSNFSEKGSILSSNGRIAQK